MLIEYTCNILQSNIDCVLKGLKGEISERGDISLSEFKDYNIVLVEYSLIFVLLICLSLMFVVGKR